MKCFPCITNYKVKHAGHDDADDPSLPRFDEEVNEAVTEAPQWQQKQIGDQMIFVCITVPACLEHVAAREKSPLELAIEGGRLLGANGG